MSEPDRSATIDLWDWRRRMARLYAAAAAAGDPRDGWALWRQGRDTLFRDHPQSPLERGSRSGFEGLRYFPYDPALRFAVPLRLAAEPPFVVDAGADGPVRLRPFACTAGLADRLGAELTLHWVEGYGGGAFLPFTDATSGDGTYGGGRYLLDTIKGADLGMAADGLTVLDFNFAYNPSCSYSPRYVCPLASAGNRLRTAVRAGEMAWHGSQL